MAAVRSIIEATEAATELYVVNVWTSFDIVAEPLVLTVATISLAVLGYLMFTGQVTMQMHQLLPRLFRWAIVLALLLNMPALYTLVYPLVTDVPDALAAFREAFVLTYASRWSRTCRTPSPPSCWRKPAASTRTPCWAWSKPSCRPA